MPQLDGFDVSHYQELFPWEHSASLGCRLGACKATQGTSFVDPRLERNRGEMRRTGHRYRGLYHWISVGADIEAQLKNFERAVGDLEPGEVVQLDCEERGITIDQILTAWQLWSARYPGRVIVYSGAFLNGWQSRPELHGIPWWLAWYGPPTWDALVQRAATKRYTFPWRPAVWQWGGGANGAVVPGVQSTDGHVDSNQILGDLEALCGLAPGTGTIPPPVQNRPGANLSRGAANNNSIPANAPHVLRPGEVLLAGESRVSLDGRFELAHQPDGNVVLSSAKRALWDSHTAGHATTGFAMQHDGRLALYVGALAVWTTDTRGHDGALLVVQDDGNAVVYAQGVALWSTRTAGGVVAPPTPPQQPLRPRLRAPVRGPWVATGQRTLNLLAGADLDVDGEMNVNGPTQRAVAGWQQFFDARPTGVVDAATWTSFDDVAALRGEPLPT